MSTNADIIVIGGGIIGLATASPAATASLAIGETISANLLSLLN